MFPQKKDIKISNRIFILSPGSYPGGGGGGGRWCAEGAKEFKKIEHGHVASQTDRDDEHNRMQVKHLFLFVVALSFGKCFPVCFLD